MKKRYLSLLIIPLLFACSNEEDNDYWGLKRTIWEFVDVEVEPEGITVEQFFELLFSETSFRAKYIVTQFEDPREEVELLDSLMWVGAYWMEDDEVFLDYKIQVKNEEGELEDLRVVDSFILDGETLEGEFDGLEMILNRVGVFEFE